MMLPLLLGLSPAELYEKRAMFVLGTPRIGLLNGNILRDVPNPALHQPLRASSVRIAS